MPLEFAWRCFAAALALSASFRGVENAMRFSEQGVGRRLGISGALLGLVAFAGAVIGWKLAAPWWTLCLLGTVESLRAQGLEQGGSDPMSLWMRAAIALESSLHESDSADQRLLAYGIATLVLASYLCAGWAKARVPLWWTGEALGAYLQRPVYLQSERVCARFPRRLRGPSGLLVIAFEVSAPLTLLIPGYLPYWALLGLLFHFANAFLFGLHRFFWVWVGTYPLLFALAP